MLLQALVLASVIVIAPAAKGEDQSPSVRDVVTHEQLEQQLRQVQQEDPMKRMPESKGEDPAQNLPKDLLSQSDILCFGGVATLLPKRAILAIPKSLASRMQLTPGSPFISWSEFYARNRGWISIVEVSRAQAEGNEPLAEDVTNGFKDSASLVVATFLGGPISVQPLKTPKPEKAAATAAATDKPAAAAAATEKAKP